MTTNELIYKAQRKDKDALKQLYISWAKHVFAICRRYSSDEMQAEDYLQESFMRIFDNLNSYNPEKGAFKNWIGQIAVNAILMDKRKEKNRSNLNASVEEEALDKLSFEADQNDFLNTVINQEELLVAIRALPTKYKDVLNLFIFDEWSHEQIAQTLNITESNSRSRLSRAKKMMKQILTKKMIFS